MSSQQIVKIQMPTEPQPGRQLALIHNQDRSLERTMFITPDIEELFSGGKTKGYFMASLLGGFITLHEEVGPQEW